MKDSKLLTATFSVLFVFGATSFADEKNEIGFEATADFANKYIWRGQNLVDDWVFQPGAVVSYGGLSASFWGNLDMTDENCSNGEFSEIDLTLDYSAQFPGIDVLGYSVGMINYDFPVNGSADDTTEVYAGLSLDVPASPSVTFYRDVDETGDGLYISFGVGHSFEYPGRRRSRRHPRMGKLGIQQILLGLGTGWQHDWRRDERPGALNWLAVRNVGAQLHGERELHNSGRRRNSQDGCVRQEQG